MYYARYQEKKYNYKIYIIGMLISRSLFFPIEANQRFKEIKK